LEHSAGALTTENLDAPLKAQLAWLPIARGAHLLPSAVRADRPLPAVEIKLDGRLPPGGELDVIHEQFAFVGRLCW
jgi:hypothetical protein